jgi:hypothetical protein
VRSGEHAFVWLAAFASRADYQSHLARLAKSRAWTDEVQPALLARLKSPPQTLRLQPTAHSRLGHGPYLGTLHDFDFFVGKWKVAHRRLKRRGVGSHEWEEFAGTCEVRQLLGGVVNVDDNDFPSKGSGMTMRTFDLGRRRWSIYWVNGREGVLSPPVVGGFEGDHGLFRGDDVDEGRPVKVLFRWTRQGPAAARWEQDFSFDGGKSWEHNWSMQFTRVQ